MRTHEAHDAACAFHRAPPPPPSPSHALTSWLAAALPGCRVRPIERGGAHELVGSPKPHTACGQRRGPLRARVHHRAGGAPPATQGSPAHADSAMRRHWLLRSMPRRCPAWGLHSSRFAALAIVLRASRSHQRCQRRGTSLTTAAALRISPLRSCHPLLTPRTTQAEAAATRRDRWARCRDRGLGATSCAPLAALAAAICRYPVNGASYARRRRVSRTQNSRLAHRIAARSVAGHPLRVPAISITHTRSHLTTARRTSPAHAPPHIAAAGSLASLPPRRRALRRAHAPATSPVPSASLRAASPRTPAPRAGAATTPPAETRRQSALGEFSRAR